MYIHTIYRNKYIYLYTRHPHRNSYTPISQLQENGGHLGLVSYRSWCKCTDWKLSANTIFKRDEDCQAHGSGPWVPCSMSAEPPWLTVLDG